MKLRVATYNIHKGISPLGSQLRIHALKQAIGMLEADVLFLQEVQGRHDLHAARYSANWPQQSQYDFLAGDSHQCAYGMNAMYEHGHHGNALLSAYPILSALNQDVSDHPFEQRGLLHCVVQANGMKIHCYVIHLGLFAGGRRRQCQALIDAVRASAGDGDPIIVAGDFNDWKDNLSSELRRSLGVREVFDSGEASFSWSTLLRDLGMRGKTKPARTFPAAMPWLRLDRIYVRGFEVEKAEVMRGQAWSRLSDHAPIVATLQF